MLKNSENKTSFRRFIPEPFILTLAFMILLAYFIPNIGMTPAYEPFKLKSFTDIGIAFIFFFYGLKLNSEKIRLGLKNWHLHISIQGITFVLFPLLVLAFMPLANTAVYHHIWLGLFFLATLPSTVSSSVVMVSIAKGNLTGAIFNASLSGLLGVVITPLWMSFFVHQIGHIDYGDVILQLITQIVLPVNLGILLQRFWGAFAERHKARLALFDKTIILLIVYQSFSHSFTSGIFRNIGAELITYLFVSVLILFFVMLYLSGKIAAWMRFNREDRITLVFCGTKKSLIHGTVMANVLFVGVENSGVFLLPIMIYHAFQLFYISIVAERMAVEFRV